MPTRMLGSILPAICENITSKVGTQDSAKMIPSTVST